MLRLLSQSRTRCGKRRVGDWIGDPMVAPRRVIALPTDEEQQQRLLGNFSVSNRAHEPCRTGTDYPGLFGGAVGVCGGADDWGDAADRDPLSQTSGGTGS